MYLGKYYIINIGFISKTLKFVAIVLSICYRADETFHCLILLMLKGQGINRKSRQTLISTL